METGFLSRQSAVDKPQGAHPAPPPGPQALQTQPGGLGAHRGHFQDGVGADAAGRGGVGLVGLERGSTQEGDGGGRGGKQRRSGARLLPACVCMPDYLPGARAVRLSSSSSSEDEEEGVARQLVESAAGDGGDWLATELRRLVLSVSGFGSWVREGLRGQGLAFICIWSWKMPRVTGHTDGAPGLPACPAQFGMASCVVACPCLPLPCLSCICRCRIPPMNAYTYRVVTRQHKVTRLLLFLQLGRRRRKKQAAGGTRQPATARMPFTRF